MKQKITYIILSVLMAAFLVGSVSTIKQNDFIDSTASKYTLSKNPFLHSFHVNPPRSILDRIKKRFV